MTDSVQYKLLRVRPPRVRITYDVETGGALEKVELPFIVGIFADLNGEQGPGTPLPPLKDRKFIDIDRDTFNEVLAKTGPQVNLTKAKVQNVISSTDKAAMLSGTLDFATLEDFSPVAIIKQVPDMKARYDVRADLRFLQSKAEIQQPIIDFLDRAVRADADGKTVRAELKTMFPPPSGDPKATDKDPTKDGEVTRLLTRLGLTGDDRKDERKQLLGLLKQFNTEVITASMDSVDADMKKAADALVAAVKADATLKDNKFLDRLSDFANLAAAPGTSPESTIAAGKLVRTELYALFPVGRRRKEFVEASPVPGGKIDKLLTDLALGRDQWNAMLAYLGDFANALRAANPDTGAAALIDNKVLEIDNKLGGQLDLILHSRHFQSLEATWRGLHYLVSRTETSATLKLKIVNATEKDLTDDLTKAVEFDQSGLFKMIYEAEYGTYGGKPFSMMIGDYTFGRNDQDMTRLAKLAEVAAAGHAPFIAAADPELFDLAGFEDLGRPRDLQKIFEAVDLIGWRNFRQSEDSRYVTLTLPRVLLRLPYDPIKAPCDGVYYSEDVTEDGSLMPDEQNKFLWGNAAWFLTERITHAFSLYGWTAAIRGVEGGGLVEGMPVYTYKSDDGDIAMVCPTQVQITDRREKELNDLGFITLCHCKNDNKAVFFGGQTTNQPKKYLVDLANANAKLSAMLPYMLAASRFAHYVKVIMRDKIGSFLTRGNVEAYLNTWIAQYVLLDENAAQEVKSAYPLSAAKIVVTDVPGSPGSYTATIFIRPHFQLEELTTSIRLVARLPG